MHVRDSALLSDDQCSASSRDSCVVKHCVAYAAIISVSVKSCAVRFGKLCLLFHEQKSPPRALTVKRYFLLAAVRLFSGAFLERAIMVLVRPLLLLI